MTEQDAAHSFEKWTIAKMFNQEVLMEDGCISALSLDEICQAMNELTRLRSELQQKDEVIKELIVVAQGLRNYSWTDEYTNQKYDLIIKRAFESIEKSKAK